MASNEPIRLGYRGVQILETGDKVLYKIEDDAGFVPAVVVQEPDPGSTGIYIKLLDDYRGKVTKIACGNEFIAGTRELYWDRKSPIPASKLEKILAGLGEPIAK